jgi:hypothetical protein
MDIHPNPLIRRELSVGFPLKCRSWSLVCNMGSWGPRKVRILVLRSWWWIWVAGGSGFMGVLAVRGFECGDEQLVSYGHSPECLE